MIFGYYTIPLKTLNREQLPEQLRPEPGAKISLGVKCFHILFIPFFPFSKSWTLKKGGDSYQIPKELEKVLDQLYGRSKTPWYAFGGFFLLFAFYIFTQIGSCNRKKRYAESREKAKIAKIDKEAKEADELQRKMNMPLPNDYYAFKSVTGPYFPVRVDQDLGDSVSLEYNTTGAGFSSSSKGQMSIDFMLDRGNFKKVTVAKADLKKALLDKQTKKSERNIAIDDLASGEAMALTHVYRAGTSTNINVKDEQTTKEIKSVFERFINNISIDSSLVLIDEYSKKYLLDAVRIASADDVNKIKEYVTGGTYPSVNYSLALYAKYSYLDGKNTRANLSNDKKTLTDFGFFSKLINVGLWSIDDYIKKASISNIYRTGVDKARGRISLRSNIIQGNASNITFDVNFVKEDGAWKVRLADTFQYTEKQVRQVGRNATEGKQQYRIMVRDAIEKLGDGETLIDRKLVF